MEQKMYNVTIQGETKQYPEGISYGDIVKEYEGTTVPSYIYLHSIETSLGIEIRPLEE